MKEWELRAIDTAIVGHKSKIKKYMKARNITMEQLNIMSGVDKEILTKFFTSDHFFEEEDMAKILSAIGLDQRDVEEILGEYAKDMIFMRRSYARDDFTRIPRVQLGEGGGLSERNP